MDTMTDSSQRHDDDTLRSLYDGFATSYRWQALLNDTVFGATSLRRWAVAHARGAVLDVACGTGENFPHLRRADSVTAVDLSPGMLAQSATRASRLGIDVDLRPMSALSLDFADGTFDTVTTAMSTCTFPDPVAALREMVRVTAPDGRVLLVEHGRSRVAWIARLQDRTADRHYRQAGCRWNQDVTARLETAGLRIEATRERTFGVFAAFITRPA